MLSFSSCVLQHRKRSIKKIPPTTSWPFHWHASSLTLYMRQVKVIDLCWAFYCCIEFPVIGIVFHCKHNLIHSYIQSLNPILKILKFKYLQIRHKACLSPFLVTNWPQRQKNIFSMKILQHRINHDGSPRQKFHMKSRVQFKFPTPNAWRSNSPSPGRLW